jgi:hypothetical protein
MATAVMLGHIKMFKKRIQKYFVTHQTGAMKCVIFCVVFFIDRRVG